MPPPPCGRHVFSTHTRQGVNRSCGTSCVVPVRGENAGLRIERSSVAIFTSRENTAARVVDTSPGRRRGTSVQHFGSEWYACPPAR